MHYISIRKLGQKTMKKKSINGLKYKYSNYNAYLIQSFNILNNDVHITYAN